MRNMLLALLIPAVLLPGAAHAQISTGQDGPFHPVSSLTLDMGKTVYNFTDIDIPSGVTVSFRNLSNNQNIEFLASGSINIAGSLLAGNHSLGFDTPNSLTISGSLQANNINLNGGIVTLTPSSTIDTYTSLIPEADSSAMMLLGLGLLGLVARRKATAQRH